MNTNTKKPWSKAGKIVVGISLSILLLVILIVAFAPDPDIENSKNAVTLKQWAKIDGFEVRVDTFDLFIDAPLTGGSAGEGLTFIDVHCVYKNTGTSKSGVYGGELIIRTTEKDYNYDPVNIRGFGKSGNLEAGEIKQTGEIFKIPIDMMKWNIYYKPGKVGQWVKLK